MAWIQTEFGKAFDLLNPRPDQVNFYEVAGALARICRFTGHIKRGLSQFPIYSVAQHSIHVAEMLAEEDRVHGILHDAKEAFVGDMSTPMKEAYEAEIPGFNMARKRLEARIEKAIYEAADVPLPSEETRLRVRHADLKALATEKRDLLNTSERSWADFGVAPSRTELQHEDPYSVFVRFTAALERYGVAMPKRQTVMTVGCIDSLKSKPASKWSAWPEDNTRAW